MRIRHKIVIRWLAAIGLMAAVLWVVDARAALESLRAARLDLVLAALLLVQGQIVLSALRWRFTARRLGQTLPFGLAVREYYLASLLNLVLPGGVGGDALRAMRATRGAAPGGATRPAVVRAVVLERLAGQIAFFAIALAGIAAWPSILGGRLPAGTLRLIVIPPLALAFAGLAVLVLARWGPALLRDWLRPLGPDIVRAWFLRYAWIVQGGLSLAIASLYIAAFALASAAVGAALPWQAWVTAIPLVLLTMLVPVSIGGFGLREGAAAALWPLFGLTASDGLAAALLYGLVGIAGALPGVLVLLARSRGQPRSRA